MGLSVDKGMKGVDDRYKNYSRRLRAMSAFGLGQLVIPKHPSLTIFPQQRLMIIYSKLLKRPVDPHHVSAVHNKKYL